MINLPTSAKASIINDSYVWTDNGNGTANLNINFTPDVTDPFCRDTFEFEAVAAQPYPNSIQPYLNFYHVGSPINVSRFANIYSMTDNIIIPAICGKPVSVGYKFILEPDKMTNTPLVNGKYSIDFAFYLRPNATQPKHLMFEMNLSGLSTKNENTKTDSKPTNEWTPEYFVQSTNSLAKTYTLRLYELLDKKFGFVGTYKYSSNIPNPSLSELSSHSQASYDAYAARLEVWFANEINTASLDNYTDETGNLDKNNSSQSDATCQNLSLANKAVISNWNKALAVLSARFNGSFTAGDQDSFEAISLEITLFDQQLIAIIKSGTKCDQLYGQKTELDSLSAQVKTIQSLILKSDKISKPSEDSINAVLDGDEVIDTSITYSKNKNGHYIISLLSDIINEPLVIKATKKGKKTIRYTITTNESGSYVFTTTRNIKDYNLKVYFDGELVDSVLVKK